MSSKNSAFIPTTFSSAPCKSLGGSSFLCPLNRPTVINNKVNNQPYMSFSLFALPSLFQRRDTVDLPQNDTENASSREQSISDAREKYKWDQNTIKGASMIEGVPDGEGPSVGWIEDLIPILLRVGINTIVNNHEEAMEDSDSLFNKISSVGAKLISTITTGRFSTKDADEAFETISDIGKSKKQMDGGTIEEHKELFDNIKLDVIAKGDQFLNDDIFGWYRVAGPNPMRITKCSSISEASGMFPELTDEIVKGIPGFSTDSLKQMQNENRLYYVSYPEFDGVPTGNDQSGKKKPGYIYSPYCLLAVPMQRLNNRVTVLPLAIRCGKDPKKYPMFSGNANHTEKVTWMAAKCTVQVADAVIHETVYHLARTHLLAGIFICATYRSLSEAHPLYRLLKCHFYGTAFINYSATTSLINPGGTIDQMTAPDIYVTRGVSAKGINGDDSYFNDWFVDVDLNNREVMDSVLPFPYRDDALAVWDATLKWVRAYISAYYKSDADVVADFELAAWCKEICDSDKGNLHGFGDAGDGVVRTVDYLVRAVANFIFTATAQHAAVNFSQSTLMQFAPAMPLAGYMPAPDSAKPFKDVAGLSRKMFPTLNASETQLNTAELIGVLNHSVYGDYGRDLEFAPDEVSDALQTFQTELGVIGGKINERNKIEQVAGLPVYNYMVPKNIPNSINI